MLFTFNHLPFYEFIKHSRPRRLNFIGQSRVEILSHYDAMTYGGVDTWHGKNLTYLNIEVFH